MFIINKLEVDKLLNSENNIFNMKRRSAGNDKEVWAEVGRLIREGIKKQKASQTKVAEHLGHTGSWLSQILNKKRGLSIPDLLKIAEYLGVQPGDLLPKNKSVSLKSDSEIEAAVEKKILDILNQHKTGGIK